MNNSIYHKDVMYAVGPGLDLGYVQKLFWQKPKAIIGKGVQESFS